MLQAISKAQPAGRLMLILANSGHNALEPWKKTGPESYVIWKL